MTNTGVLSLHYEALSKRLNDFNDSVIVLKKYVYSLLFIERESEVDIRYHVLLVKEFLESLLRILTEDGYDIRKSSTTDYQVAQKLAEIRVGDFQDFLNEMQRILTHLNDSVKSLDENDFQILDFICWSLDFEVSLAFRRVWGK